MNFLKRCATIFVLLASGHGVVSAQVPTGTPPFGSFGGGPDVINLANLNAHLAIPVLHKAGRGLPFSYDIVYDSSVWYPVTSGGTPGWQPVQNFGWLGQTGIMTGYVSFSTITYRCDWPPPKIGSFSDYYNFAYHDTFGVTHPFNDIALEYDPTGCDNGNTTTSSGSSVDGSGMSLTASTSSHGGSPHQFQLTTRSGQMIVAPVGQGLSTITDTNGNQISTNGSGVYTDTLGTTAVSVSGNAPSPTTFTYTAPNGHPASYIMNYIQKTVRTNFGCSGITEYGPTSVNLVSSISLPDGSAYIFTYEQTPGFSGDYTGRLASVKLPTGGTISYSYSGGKNGVVCADGSTAGLTRTTPDGVWNYSRVIGTGAASTTTITDPTPQANQTVINFQGIYETTRQVNQGASTLLRTVRTCYNGATVPCDSTLVTLPITQQTQQVSLPGGLQSEHDFSYTSAGQKTEIDDYDYGSGTKGVVLKKTIMAPAAYGNYLQVTVQDGGSNTISQTNYGYDESAVIATTGTPQLVAVTASRGNLTSVNSLSQGVTKLSKIFTYYDTGNVQTTTDVNSAPTTYSYTGNSCGNSFVTGVSLPLSLSDSIAWNCTGGVVTSVTDENSQPTTIAYTDPYFWRPASAMDPTNAMVNLSYPSANAYDASLPFNGTVSVADALTNVDGLGRVHVQQAKQSPSSSTYDSVETDYDSLGRPSRVTLPYSGIAGQTNSSAPGVTTAYDALSRATQQTDSGGGTVSYSYPSNQNNTLVTVGPAPAGENTKRRQLQYNALGQLTSVCELTSGTGAGTCAQTVPATGYWTKYAYDPLSHVTGVMQNAQGTAQARAYTYDFAGRVLTERAPESGLTSYVYDTDTTCGTSNGDLVKRTDAVGNVTCYSYDALHRPLSITYPSGPYAASTSAKYFVYDAATVNGQAMANGKKRMVEAYTATCQTCAKITDVGISYTVRGEVADVYQATPHSGGYYHLNQTYWANGLAKQLSGLPGLPTMNITPDGEGRVNAVTAGSGQSPVSSTGYNTFGMPTAVHFGSLDSDGFSFDLNTARMTGSTFSVGAQTVTGTLTWNANGAMQKMQITDPLNSADSQTCTYAHDDESRIAGANCGTAWSQTFSYDAFGNVSKSGSISFLPTYSTATNHISQLPGGFTPTYDANGNLMNDSFHQYTLDAENHPLSIDSVNVIYDALGRMVEQNRSGVYTELVYSPSGAKLALMTGQTLKKAFVGLPGNAVAVYGSSGLAYYRHADWLGSSRLASTPTRTMYSDTAYAPFGETYAQAGTTDASFTGQNQDTVTGLYDFPAREYSSTQGRWSSPDPYRGSYDIANPQSMNRYAYVRNNPLSLVDPLGLTVNCYDVTASWTDEHGNTWVWAAGQVCYDDGQGGGGDNFGWGWGSGSGPVNGVPSGGGVGSGSPSHNPCSNPTLSAAGVNIQQRIATTNKVTALGALATILDPFTGAFAAFAALVHTGGPYDDKNQPGPGTHQQRVDAGNISYGVTCPFGAGFCQFAAGAAQTLALHGDPSGTLKTGYDTPSDNASIRIGQAMRAAGCHD